MKRKNALGSLLVLCTTVLITTGCAQLILPQTDSTTVVDPEAAYFELADRVFPAGDTAMKVSAADEICNSLKGGHSRTVTARVVAEAAPDIASSDVDDLASRAIAFKCPDL